MWAIIGILVSGAIISLFEIPPLLKKKCWREIIFFFLLFSPGVTLSILLSKQVTIPTPVDLISKIYSPITSFFERIFS
jgi:hypothetical protein